MGKNKLPEWLSQTGQVTQITEAQITGAGHSPLINTPLFLTPGSAGSFSGEEGLFILLPQLCPSLSLLTSLGPLCLGKRSLGFRSLGGAGPGVRWLRQGKTYGLAALVKPLDHFSLQTPDLSGSASPSLTPAQGLQENGSEVQ